ncbi:MAG: hypothetical protein ACI3XV_08610 [Bacteroidaceae bacterium]
MTKISENMGQLTALVEAICKDFRGHDEGEIRKLVEWQRVMKTQAQHMPLLRVHGPLDGLSSKTALIVRYLGMP